MKSQVNEHGTTKVLNRRRGSLVSLLRWISIGIFSTTTLAILLSTFIFLYAEYRRDVAEVRKDLTDQTKAMMREQVDHAVEFIEFARKDLGWSTVKTQEFIKKRLEQVSYADGQGYIFVDSYKGVVLAHPSGDLVGRDLWEMEDINGVKIAQQLVEAAMRGGDFVSYAWLHPITNKHEQKLTYARSIDDWQWAVCSGLYLVDVDRAVAARNDKLSGDLTRHGSIILCLATFSLGLFIICSLRISRRAGNELRQLETGIIAGSSAHEQISPEAYRIREFEVIAAGLKEAFCQVEQTTDKLIREQEVVRASEQQLKSANQQLSANEQEREGLVSILKYKNKELQDIVYTTSHDLRSPLVNIEGFSGELQTDCEGLIKMLAEQHDGQDKRQQIEAVLKENIPESLKFITGSVKKMSSLLNGLLQISRVGTFEISSEPIDMNKTVDEVLAAMEYQVKENNMTVKVETLAGCVSDLNMVNTVFSNLVGNAIKYRDPAKDGEIRISSSKENGMSVYCVQDNGIGIEDSYQSKVFEIFHRLEPDDNIEGEGLGLTIVTRIMDRLGGKIRLDSEAGKRLQVLCRTACILII